MSAGDLDLEHYRSLLEQRRAGLVAAVEGLNHEVSLVDEAGGIVSTRLDDHPADAATDTFARELDEGLEDDAVRLLADVDAALARIEAGTYGLCRVCGREIGEERLEAVPTAILCIEDKRRDERT